MSKNIYICSRAGGGKDTLAEHLVKNFNYSIAKFAYPVYDIARNYFGMKGKNRQLLIDIGTKFGRKIDENIWVKRLVEDINIVQQYYQDRNEEIPNFVLTDCRFENEHKWLKDNGWVGFYLECPEEVRIKRLTERDGDAQVNTLNDVSEVSVDLFKHELMTVDTSGSIYQSYNNFEEQLYKIGVK